MKKIGIRTLKRKDIALFSNQTPMPSLQSCPSAQGGFWLSGQRCGAAWFKAEKKMLTFWGGIDIIWHVAVLSAPNHPTEEETTSMDYAGFALFLIQAPVPEDQGVMNLLVQKFIEGGFFMWPILTCLIIGLAFAFERFWTLSKASVNTRKFILSVKKALDDGGVDKAVQVCANTRGPVASVFQAGLLRAHEGIEAAEKAIIAYGGIEMAFLEKGLVWLSLFITMAPMLGFTGTVQGMIQAFDAIKEAKNISPEIVAGGISVALLTTLFGLIVAMILQTLYNYFVSRIDRLVSDMEESSIELIDSLAIMQQGKKVSGSTPETKGRR